MNPHTTSCLTADPRGCSTSRSWLRGAAAVVGIALTVGACDLGIEPDPSAVSPPTQPSTTVAAVVPLAAPTPVTPTTVVAPTPPAPTPPAPATPSTTVATPTPVPGEHGFLNEAEVESLRLLNEFRASQGVGPVKAVADLSAFSRSWSEEMNRTGFRHSSGADRRALITGTRTGNGENIVWYSDGAETPAAIAARFEKMWEDSPGHRSNMLNPEWTEVGVGMVRTADNGWFGTHNFANG